MLGSKEGGGEMLTHTTKTSNSDNGNKQRERREALPRPAAPSTPRGGTEPTAFGRSNERLPDPMRSHLVRLSADGMEWHLLQLSRLGPKLRQDLITCG